MTQITITEALAEVKTITKRIEKKREHILQYLVRQEGLKDPLEKSGGSVKSIVAERQSIYDLQRRWIQIRSAIMQSNLSNTLTVEGHTQSVADWLTWRREIAEANRAFLNRTRSTINQARTQAQAKGVTVRSAAEEAKSLSDLLVNVDESDLGTQIELIESVLGQLDGKLSLANATTTITLTD